jgi:hypothetical protein
MTEYVHPPRLATCSRPKRLLCCPPHRGAASAASAAKAASVVHARFVISRRPPSVALSPCLGLSKRHHIAGQLSAWGTLMRGPQKPPLCSGAFHSRWAGLEQPPNTSRTLAYLPACLPACLPFGLPFCLPFRLLPFCLPACLLPTAHCLLPTAHCLLPTAYHRVCASRPPCGRCAHRLFVRGVRT